MDIVIMTWISVKSSIKRYEKMKRKNIIVVTLLVLKPITAGYWHSFYILYSKKITCSFPSFWTMKQRKQMWKRIALNQSIVGRSWKFLPNAMNITNKTEEKRKKKKKEFMWHLVATISTLTRFTYLVNVCIHIVFF